VLDGRYDDFIAEFSMTLPRQLQVEVVGEEQTFEFGIYSGPGVSGWLAGLQAQLLAKVGMRHEKFSLNIPEGADYILVNFPPSPVAYNAGRDGDLAANVRQPSGGTYRLADGVATLSVDYVVSMGLPLRGQWRDADQEGDEYLARIPRINMLTAPEYFVPVGVSFDPCMTDGNCSDALLDQIINTRMEMTVHYYRVGRITQGLIRLPLRAVGPDWDPGELVARAVPAAVEASRESAEAETAVVPPVRYFLPLVSEQSPVEVQPDDPTGCPCGWFTPDGRMVDFVPEP
jgi:hypothetical protein